MEAFTKDCSRYLLRELSWNSFNFRVMSEGENLKPLDSLKFMAITSSNYDDFFMIRVARLMRKVREGDLVNSPDAMSPSLLLIKLLKDIRAVVEKQDICVRYKIFPVLASNGMHITELQDWDLNERRMAADIFEKELFPICTPIVFIQEEKIDAAISQGRIHAAFSLNDGRLAIIRLPGKLDRFREFQTEGGLKIILLEDILIAYADKFFSGKTLETSCLFRVTRNADFSIDEDLDMDFLSAMEEALQNRKNSFPVRLESHGDFNLAKRVRGLVGLPKENHFHLSSPLNLKAFFRLCEKANFEHLKTPYFTPQSPWDFSEGEDIWETLKEKDLLLHHPYESFTPVIHMAGEAAEDPATLAIKATLYRTSGNSPIVNALIRAAENGVQVTVVVEPRARFDESANLDWAAQLEHAGAIVIYGLSNFKVHLKALMVIRREEDGIRRYLHLGTGNYNDVTATLYSDLSLITSNTDFTRDAALIFNAITGYSSEPRLKKLFIAPFSLRQETLRLIEREEKRARSGESAEILGKMNSLVDTEIIDALYRASEAGVKISLNVRGACCLRPGVRGLSENIRIISIIDTFLEHSRIFIYRNGGRERVFLSSSDWMPRNLNSRIEVLFPIENQAHKRRVRSILESYFRDNTKSWELRQNGSWERCRPNENQQPFRAQKYLANTARLRAEEKFLQEKKALGVRRYRAREH